MKNVLILLTLFSFSTVCYADDAKGKFDLGTELSYISYKEPGVMSEKGAMYGITGSYAYHDTVMLKAEGNVDLGVLNYDGQTFNGTPEKLSGIGNCKVELRGLLGVDLKSPGYVLTSYTGIGYRFLRDGLNNGRYSNYIYQPVGLELTINSVKGWSITPKAEYDFFYWGREISYMDGLEKTPLVNTQTKGYGLRGSIQIIKKGIKKDLTFEPYVKYWNLKESDHVFDDYNGQHLYWYEPDNHSTEIGCRFEVRF